MRRTIIIGTALAVLSGAAAAYAAGSFDTFTATSIFCKSTASFTATTCSPATAGSKSKPVSYSMVEHWTAKASGGGNAAPLTKIVAKVYGVVSNGKKFPVCTAAQINADKGGKWNKVCPKGSQIGGGPVQATLTGPTGGSGTACDPYLDIYNGGQNKQTFFFVVGSFAPSTKYECAGGTVQTGTGCAAYTGTIKQSGGYSILTINLPGCASTNAGNIGAYAALQKLDVAYTNLTKKVGGKKIGYEQSVACKGGKRPYSFTFTAQNFKGHTPATQTTTIKHTAAC